MRNKFRFVAVLVAPVFAIISLSSGAASAQSTSSNVIPLSATGCN
jgi:hypothetical protein